jgi:heme exporter protein C
VGAVNLPIVHFSVVWWNSLHQGETIFTSQGPKAAAVYLWPLGLMSLAYMLGFGALWMERVRSEIWRRRASALAVQGAR